MLARPRVLDPDRPMNRTRLPQLALALALVVPAAAQDPAPTAGATTPPAAPASSPFLWRIEGKGTSAYLYGTIHLPDERVLAMPGTVEQAFAEADAFFAEIEATAASERAVQEAAQLEAGVDPATYMTDATWARIEERLTRKGVPAAVRPYVRQMEPWAIGALLPTLDYFEEQAAGKAPLDKALYLRARTEGKEVGGLETVAEQLAVFGGFTREEHGRMLVDALDQLDDYEKKGRNPVEEMIGAWRSGDEKRLMELLDDGFGKDPVLRDRMESRLLWQRNQLIAERIAARMAKDPSRTVFFAVGALHLPDPRRPEEMTEEQRRAFDVKKGLVTLLRERGYRLERVEATPAAVGGDR